MTGVLDPILRANTHYHYGIKSQPAPNPQGKNVHIMLNKFKRRE